MTISNQDLINHFVSLIVNKASDKKIMAIKSGYGYSRYQDNPIGFGEDILDDTYTDDIKKVMDSIIKYPVTIARSANAVGKTHCAARIGVWFYKVFDDAQVYTTAAPPEDNLKKLLWGEIGSIVNKYPQLFKRDKVNVLHIERNPQSFLTGVTIPTTGTAAQREARFSGKHAPHILFIKDEGDAIPDEVYRGAEACMSGGFARMLILLNPRAGIGPVYAMERDRRANVIVLSAFRHPNVIVGQNVIPGAVTREKTVRRINLWARHLKAEESHGSDCFELPSFLVGAIAEREDGTQFPPLEAGWYKVMEPAFSYMVLGEYPTQAVTQLISKEWINAARSRWDAYVAEWGERPPVNVSPVLGLDIAEYGVDSNVACPRYGGWVPRLTTWTGIDTIETGDEGIRIYNEIKAMKAYIDATGVGAGVAPQMERAGCDASPVKVASSPTEKTEMGEFGILRDQLWWACREWLRTDQGAMLPPDEKLCEELTMPMYEIKGGKIKVTSKDVMKEKLKRSPDRADALCLTFAPNNESVGIVFL